MRPFLFRLAAVVLGCLVALLLLEAWLRASPPGWVASRNWPVDRRDGRAVGFLPGTTFEALHFEYHHPVTIDARGGRTTSPCDPGEAPIPFVGDSYVFGLGVGDSETFVSLVSAELDRCMLNLGIPGAGTSDELHLIRARHAELGSPDTYVIGVFSNDLDVANTENPIVGGGLSWLVRRSYAVQFLRIETSSMRERIGRRMQRRPGFYTMMTRRSEADRVAEGFQHQADSLAELARRLRFRPVVVLVPFRNEVFVERLEAQVREHGLAMEDFDPDQPDRILTGLFRERGITVISLLECLRGHAGEELHYPVDTHFNAAGHRAAAACMAPGLRAALADSLRS